MPKPRSRPRHPPQGPVHAQAARAGGPIVAVELAPVPAVQAVWRARSDTRGAALALCVGAGPLLACCPRAQAAGVMPGQSVAQALLRCPDLLIAPPDPPATLLLWEQTLETLSGVSPGVEAADPAAGLAYLDAGGLQRLWGDGAAVARAALQALAAQGLSARAGAGPSRVVARALARRMDANGPRSLAGAEAGAFLRALPLSEVGLGLALPVVAALQELGVTTLGALATLPPAGLGLRFGPSALEAWRTATGAEEAPLSPWTAPPCVEVTYRVEEGLADAVMLGRLLGHLSAELAARLATHGWAAAALTLDLRCAGAARHVQRVRPWPPLTHAPAIQAAALDLLAHLRLETPVEEVALRATDLGRPLTAQHALWDAPAGAAQGARRQERVAAVLAAQQRRHERLRLCRLQADPLAEEGWTWVDVEPGA